MRLGGLLLSLVVGFGLAAASSSAATFEVTKRGDHAPGPCTRADCTVREAVLEANASVGVGDRILLPSRRPYRLSIPGIEDGAAGGDLDLTNGRVSIVHRGRGRATIDASGLDRAVDVYARSALRKVELTGGVADYGGGSVARSAGSTSPAWLSAATRRRSAAAASIRTRMSRSRCVAHASSATARRATEAD